MQNENKQLSHVDSDGAVRMVDVSNKPVTTRVAIASCIIRMSQDTFNMILQEKASKGNVLETARLAGIMAAKKTSDLIPLCHPLPISQAKIDFSFNEPHSISVQSMVKTNAQTGVEMEALTSVSVAALTVYDMCKAVDKGMIISDIGLVKKTGGKSGDWQAAVS
ncbi:MAG: Molybdenum cofactor biosynthesis protein C [Candidatus Magnetoglobus multicellularis str. Araruama]|uniref:Cyclic pyranopterin monophosphate synthase n=1 Tax=Candidatus Magnetoglobus multicellularis str. Araruama TaxID=890399 RepID=A0A1V1PHF6_9BACT|nr:MAG: Molybdenum cofactor biosynthesis protein C [Candidatus Magnetoglobus multicellularis str. Araruama]